MTDNEIIKALDICGHLEACADCPLGCLEGVDKCMHTLLLNALDLINRQKAEIERLQSVNADMQESLRLAAEVNKDMQAEVERWKTEGENSSVLWRDHFESIFESAKETIRSEAIKEFASRLVENIFPLGYLYDGNYSVNAKAVKVAIDNIVKEMTEEQCNV